MNDEGVEGYRMLAPKQSCSLLILPCKCVLLAGWPGCHRTRLRERVLLAALLSFAGAAYAQAGESSTPAPDLRNGRGQGQLQAPGTRWVVFYGAEHEADISNAVRRAGGQQKLAARVAGSVQTRMMAFEHAPPRGMQAAQGAPTALLSGLRALKGKRAGRSCPASRWTQEAHAS